MPNPPDGPADWQGFHAPRYTQIPDELFDVWLPHLSEAELKVLLYIMRHTFGWKKDSDAISLRQMAEGIVRRDGTRLDSGAGVALRSIQRALPELERKRLITATRTMAPDGSPATTVYTVCLAGVAELAVPRSQNGYIPPVNLAPGVAPEWLQQETPVQETPNKNGSAPPLPQAVTIALATTAPQPAAINWHRAAVLCAERGAAAVIAATTPAAQAAATARGDKAAAYWHALEAALAQG